MTLDPDDIEQVRELQSSTMPKWLVPAFISNVSLLVIVGLWAGSIRADVDSLMKSRDELEPVSVETSASLREIKADLKFMRKDLERARFEVDIMQSDMKDFRAEINNKIDKL